MNLPDNQGVYECPHAKFRRENAKSIAKLGEDEELANKTKEWMQHANGSRYPYHFDWLGRPIIQYPQDIVAMQELVWRVQPDLIIETGIAHGGSLIFSASMLALLDMCDAIEGRTSFNPAESQRCVVGVDIDIRHHNREAIDTHPMRSRIQMIEGSSVEPSVVEQVHALAAGHQRILVCLDSNHTHEHVLAELNAYAPLVTVGSYCVVFDTVIEDMPADMFPDRPWGPGDNPKTAVWEYLKTNSGFVIDKDIEHKLLITVAPDGFLKRVA